MTLVMPPKSLDDAGRCCGRKPMVYKRPHRLFCPRCDAEYKPETGRQQANWCYLAAVTTLCSGTNTWNASILR